MSFPVNKNPITGSTLEFLSPVYNTDGTLASATIEGVSYVFTYANGKLATAVSNGKTSTYTWANGRLISVAVS